MQDCSIVCERSVFKLLWIKGSLPNAVDVNEIIHNRNVALFLSAEGSLLLGNG